MKKLFVSSIFLVTLTACTFTREMHLPDGSLGYNIQCDGSANSISNCFQRAGELCGSGGYSQMTRESQAIPVGSSVLTPQGVFISYAGAAVSRTLIIKCNSGMSEEFEKERIANEKFERERIEDERKLK